MTLKPSEFPVGKVPQAAYTGTDVLTVDDADTEINAVVADGIDAGVTVLIIGTAEVITGANTSDMIITIYEAAHGGDTVGEPVNIDDFAAADLVNFCIMRVQQAYQTNPRYVLSILCTSASAACTASNSCIAVIPIGG